MTTAAAPSSNRRAAPALRDAVELLSSMRFAISLLAIICVASVIGTVVKQNEPLNNYVNQFGPFWSDVFARVNLYTVYSAWWFLLILLFLVLSVSLCVIRNTPKIIADLRNHKEHLREQSLAAFHHKACGELHERPNESAARTQALLAAQGWTIKTQLRANGLMLAARKGASNKLGYIAAHSAIVLICVGGLLDGDLIVRAQMLLQGKALYDGSGVEGEVPERFRLSGNNPTFRGNLPVAEGQRGSTAVLNMPGGIVLQELPFDVELKKFNVEYYETGMPRLFASTIVIHDHDTGEQIPAIVKVNQPAHHRGITIYQSGFDDGGSALKLRGWPLEGGEPFDLSGTVGGGTPIDLDGEPMKLEFTGLRVINVENFGTAAASGSPSATDVRKVDLASRIESRLGSGAKGPGDKLLRNIGPSVSYTLRDGAGQAREYNNYMLPVELDGQRFFMAGVRDRPQDRFRYLRIPADDGDSIEGWLRLRGALMDAALRERAARQYVAIASPAGDAEAAEQLRLTSLRALALFAGAGNEGSNRSDGDERSGGFTALSLFIETNLPQPERSRTSDVLLRILSGSLFELLKISREQAGLPAPQLNAKNESFMTQALLSLSDSFEYPAPIFLQLTDFKQLQASIFQVARAPGRNLVYLGAVLLIIGVFAMLYVRERRLWVWIAPAADEQRSQLTAAMSTSRRTLDTDVEFDRLRMALLKESA
jgi:cytochrome c biogenesis protein